MKIMHWMLPLSDGRYVAVELADDVITVEVSDGQNLTLPAIDVGTLCLGLQECAALASRMRDRKVDADGTAEMQDGGGQLTGGDR